MIALVMVYGAGLGIYHAGVEWRLWEGPATCASGAAAPATVGAMLESLQPGNIGLSH